MKQICSAAVLVCALLAGIAGAQTPPSMPKPGPELKRLDYFAGNWSTEVTMQPGPMGPGGKATSKEHNDWYPGGFFLVSHADMVMGGMGTLKEMAIFGYDPRKKQYTYHAINSIGESEDYFGNVNGPDWTWEGESPTPNGTMKGRFTLHEESATSYTMKFEGSTDGGATWKSFMEGKGTKGSGPAKTGAKPAAGKASAKPTPPKTK